MDTEPAGSLADRHLIESGLGRGGIARVYVARDLKHDRNVAVKVVRPTTRLAQRCRPSQRMPPPIARVG